MFGKRYFLNLCAGTFSEVVPPGQTRHEFDNITGRLLHITFQTTAKTGDETMRLYVVDDVNLFIVSMYVKSLPFNAFAKIVRNLDFHHELTLKVKRTTNQRWNKPQDLLTIEQFGTSIRWFPFDEKELPTENAELKQFYKSIIVNETFPALERILNPFPLHPIYRPIKNNNGLQGGYFKNDTTKGGRSISDEEVKESGWKTRSEYIMNSRRGRL
jgi:hypothetical protein